MQDIHEVLRRKQAQHAELGRQIEQLQSAAETLRAVAPLLEDSNDGNSTKMGSFAETPAPPMAKVAAANASPAPAASPKPAAAARTTVPRWP